jgi:hypothetical protein
MRTVLLLVFALSANAAPMTKGERDRLVAHLELTTSWLRDEVASLSKAQLNFKSKPEAWSVLNVVEHLTIAEPQYWQWLNEALKLPANDKPTEAKDEGILWYGIDRTQRARTADERAAKGDLKDVKEGLADFSQLRAAMVSMAKATDEDLRGRRFKGGNMDVYQWFLMISTHSQRHILQIREIKSNLEFPKK